MWSSASYADSAVMPTGSVFAGVRLRTDVAKRARNRDNVLFRFRDCARKRWPCGQSGCRLSGDMRCKGS
jgi:hypothetical protein